MIVEIITALVACGIGFCLAFGAITKFSVLTRVTYQIILKGDENSVTILNKFDRLYWSSESANKDIKKLQDECETVRSNFVGGDDFILSLINENFEIDYKQVYIEHTASTVKPL